MKSPRRLPPAQAKAGSIAPEIVLIILSHVRHPRDTLPDPPHVLPTLRAVPLVCRAWHQPGTEVLYQRIVFSSASSRPAKLLTRSIRANPPLARFVAVLSFPDLRFRPCDYYRNERSAVRLRNYAALIRMCPNVVFLRLPTNIHNAPSPRGVPALPLPAAQTRNLLSLHLTTHPASARYASTAQALSCAPLTFLPIHTAFPSLVHLTLANFTLTLEGHPLRSRLLLPSLPALRSLTLSACLLDTRAAAQLFTAVRPSLRHLELWQCGPLPSLTDSAFLILGPALEGLGVDAYVYTYYAMQDAPAPALPRLRTLRLAAEQLSVEELRRLPPSLERLTITALPACRCAACAKGAVCTSASERGSDMGVALALALAHQDFAAERLREIVLAGRCCAWHQWDGVLAQRCAARGIRLVRDVDGAPGKWLLSSRSSRVGRMLTRRVRFF
ncbi:hypothetical protein JB92DRAFT_2083200 [Gautieria morchelliformis]|nr:hypothetical protein JB92DRAFT_2083200 [Gautieria morchelliformis]